MAEKSIPNKTPKNYKVPKLDSQLAEDPELSIILETYKNVYGNDQGPDWQIRPEDSGVPIGFGAQYPIGKPNPNYPPKEVTPTELTYMPSMSAAISTGGDGTAPVMPSFGRVTPGDRSITPFTPYQSPRYQQQISGGDLAAFLARPERSDLTLPILNGSTGFGLTPEMITSGLNTNLQYQQAIEAQKQQDFANRTSQLATAGSMEDRSRADFNTNVAGKSANINRQIAERHFKESETPETARIRNAEVALKLQEYKGNWDLSKLQASAKSKLLGGDLNDVQKKELALAIDQYQAWQKAIPKIDFAEAVSSGDTAVLLEALSAGTSTLESAKMKASLPQVFETLRKYGVVVDDTSKKSDGEVEDIYERIRRIEAAAQGK